MWVELFARDQAAADGTLVVSELHKPISWKCVAVPMMLPGGERRDRVNLPAKAVTMGSRYAIEIVGLTPKWAIASASAQVTIKLDASIQSGSLEPSHSWRNSITSAARLLEAAPTLMAAMVVRTIHVPFIESGSMAWIGSSQANSTARTLRISCACSCIKARSRSSESSSSKHCGCRMAWPSR